MKELAISGSPFKISHSLHMLHHTVFALPNVFTHTNTRKCNHFGGDFLLLRCQGVGDKEYFITPFPPLPPLLLRCQGVGDKELFIFPHISGF